ncbi:MAG: DUF6077 domain-containing protein [Lachnospiraceae bacterium]|nr:DUF6077 domain-containing protein [Lachnospiraceae bacterium]
MILLISWLMILWGFAEGAYLYVLLTDGSLAVYERLLAPALIAGAAAAFLLCLLYRRLRPKMEQAPCAGKLSLREGGAYFIIFAAAGIVTLSHFAGSYVVDLSDAVYEMAVNAASGGLLAGQHPFTGETAGTIPSRIRILGLYALYAAIMDRTGLSAYELMGQIVPVLVWLLHMGVMYSLGRTLLAGRERYLWLFLSLAAVIDLATSQIEGMIGYRLFYAGFSGETIRAAVLLPYCVLCCCQKRWLPALLCAAAEAMLVWTTYGIGYCILVIVIFFAVTVWQKRRAQT